MHPRNCLVRVAADVVVVVVIVVDVVVVAVSEVV